MSLPPARLDPSRLPGRASDATDDAATPRPRRIAVLIVILLAIAAIPTMIAVALARLSGGRP